ncbi:MAG: fibrobacter succinogenes major paralogous domain-containing protein [Bacteroidales bacterium]|nr:fibrobacter succinogenes major paralogous domain-containing protein [Bacteroidales bacterium]MDY0142278.1 fibrobacter succinogenes major paralogous domain-containing protein [Bacteroidales bacterium]
MKQKTNLLIYPLLLMGLLLVFANSCEEKGDDDFVIPVLSTSGVTDITSTTAKCGGNITSDGGAEVTARGVCWSTNPSPTISDNKTTDGISVGVFSSSLSGLSPETTYYVRAYATNIVGTRYGDAITFTTKENTSVGSFTDSRDDNVYQTVSIGNQVWMAENLKYLPMVVNPALDSETTPCMYIYDYEGSNISDAKATENYTTYGVLYNWPAAMDVSVGSATNPSGVQGVCPDGWHLPSDAEWTELTDYLGGNNVAGGKLKETGTTHWNSPNTGATNETGFTALAGGYRDSNGVFYNLGNHSYWWSTTEDGSGNVSYCGLNCDNSEVSRYDGRANLGFYIRCVKN